MNVKFPTFATATIVQRWGNVNPQMYANGRHMGIDIAGIVGTPIYAACDGTVEEVNVVGAHGYGRHVIIQHDGFKTLYAHLHKVMVAQGETIEAGHIIGEMGGDPHDDDKIDGASTGTHLHFEVILPEQPKVDCIKTFAGFTVDPFPYLLNRFAPAPMFRGKVIERTGVRIRPEPSNAIASRYVGSFSSGDEFDIAKLEQPDSRGYTWAQVRSVRPEYVCVAYQGREYVKLGSVPDVVVSYEPDGSTMDDPAGGPGGPATVDEKAIRLDEVNKLIAYLQNRLSELK